MVNEFVTASAVCGTRSARHPKNRTDRRDERRMRSAILDMAIPLNGGAENDSPSRSVQRRCHGVQACQRVTESSTQLERLRNRHV